MTLKLKSWSTVSWIEKIAMKVEPISKLNNFVVVRENRFIGGYEVKKKYGEVKSQHLNIICTYAAWSQRAINSDCPQGKP